MSYSAALAQRSLPRGGLMLALIGGHIALFFALTRWSPVTAFIEAPPIEAQILSEVTADLTPPKPPAPDLMQAKLPTLDMPVVQIPTETPAPTAITMSAAPPAPASAPVAAPQSMPKMITDVAYVEAPQPRYPAESRRSREEGLVVLRVLIDEAGHARQIEVHQSSGHPRLDEAARQAVFRALFRPYIQNGAAQRALVMIPIEFALTGRSARTARAG